MPEAQNLQSTQVIAKLFGVSTRRIEQLKTEGIIKGQGKPTKYDLLSTIQSYIKYLSDKAYGRAKRESVEKLEEAKLTAEVDIKKSKAEAAKLELAELRGQMHRSEDVEAMTTNLVFAIRSALIALPGRLAVDVSSAKNADECSVIIRREVNAILDELSRYRYDPTAYEKRVRDREKWQTDEKVDTEK